MPKPEEMVTLFPEIEGLTRNFTPLQRNEVDQVLETLRNHIATTLNVEANRIRLLDDRPPGDRFLYPNQGMLEDLIAILQAAV